MLLRLLLTLMLAFSVSPVGASDCHEAMPMAAGMTMPQHVPGKATPAHVCIGCTLPADRLGARIALSAYLPALPPVSRIAHLDLLGALPPDVPPPRNG